MNENNQYKEFLNKLNVITHEIIDVSASLKDHNFDTMNEIFTTKITDLANLSDEFEKAIKEESKDAEPQIFFLVNCLNRIRLKAIHFLEVSQTIVASALNHLAKEEQRIVSRELRESIAQFKGLIQVIEDKSKAGNESTTISHRINAVINQSYKVLITVEDCTSPNTANASNIPKLISDCQAGFSLLRSLTESCFTESEGDKPVEIVQKVDQLYTSTVNGVIDVWKKMKKFPSFAIDQSAQLQERISDDMFEFVMSVIQVSMKISISDIRPSRPARSNKPPLGVTSPPPVRLITENEAEMEQDHDHEHEHEHEHEDENETRSSGGGRRTRRIGVAPVGKLIRQKPIGVEGERSRIGSNPPPVDSSVNIHAVSSSEAAAPLPANNNSTKLESSQSTVEIDLRNTKLAANKKKKKKKMTMMDVPTNLEGQLAFIAVNVLLDNKCLTSEWGDDSSIYKLREKLASQFGDQIANYTHTKELALKKNAREQRVANESVASKQKSSKKRDSKEPNTVENASVYYANKWKHNSRSMKNILKSSILTQLKVIVIPFTVGTQSLIDSICGFLDSPTASDSFVAIRQTTLSQVSKYLRNFVDISERSGFDVGIGIDLPMKSLLSNFIFEGNKNDVLISCLGSETPDFIQLTVNEYRYDLCHKLIKLRSLVVQITENIAHIGDSLANNIGMTQFQTLIFSIINLLKQISDMITTFEYLSMRYICNADDDDDEADDIDVISVPVLEGSCAAQSPLSIQLASAELIEDEIWKEEPLSPNAPLRVTLNQLIIELTNPNASYDLKKVFIRTSSCFTDSYIVFPKLKARFHCPNDTPSHLQTAIQTLVVQFLISYMESEPLQFSDSLLKAISEFADKEVVQLSTQLCDQLKTTVENTKATRKKLLWPFNPVSPIPPIPSSQLAVSHVGLLLSSSEDSIAKTLTHIDSQYFSKIRPWELLDLAWSSKKIKHRAQNVLNLIHRLNDVSYWVASVVLFHSSLSDRAKCFEKFIGVCEELQKLNNFNGVMGVMAGLNMACIARLNMTKTAVNEQKLAIFDEIQKLLSPMNNWKNYRQSIQSCSRPALPYLGMYLSDLTFTTDGNANIVNNKINFEKWKLIYNILDEIEQFQSVQYKFEVNDTLNTFLSDLPRLLDEDLYKLSLKREPRGVKNIADLMNAQ